MSKPPLPFTEDELFHAFHGWIFSESDDPRAMLNRLHLSGTRKRIRNQLRDIQLAAAAALISPYGTLYGQSIALQAECRAFGGCIWPSWHRLDEPPIHSSEIAKKLFWAFKFHCGIRENRQHGPAEWGLSQFRKLLEPVHQLAKKSA